MFFEAMEEKVDTERLQAHNRKLLENILPVHVAEYFLKSNQRDKVQKFLKNFHLSIFVNWIISLGGIIS